MTPSMDKAGVLTGDNVRKLFDYAKENKVSVLASKQTTPSNAGHLVRDSCEFRAISRNN